jgi:hypothetical protein
MTENTEAQSLEIEVSADGSSAAASSQGDLLAGKFKTQDDLVKAYKELETKLGQPTPQQSAAEEAEDTTEEEAETTPEGEEEDAEAGAEPKYPEYGEAVSGILEEAGIDPSAAAAEYAENGSLSEETIQSFVDGGIPREILDAYLRGLASAQADATAGAEAEVASIKAVAGGEEGFAELEQWIAQNVPADDAAAYIEAVNSGDAAKGRQAVEDMVARRTADLGTEGKLAGGKTPGGVQGYATESDMLADMAKPEYKTSQSFRDQVAAKIAVSNIFVTR